MAKIKTTKGSLQYVSQVNMLNWDILKVNLVNNTKDKKIKSRTI